jgi:hypothetical protein
MLPTNALYTRKKESAAGRRFRTSIQPQQGSAPYVGSNTITINIPTAANQLLIPTESTLNFTLTGTNSSGNQMNVLRWDSCGAHGIIQRLRVYHGSSLLEDIDNYGQLAKMLFDFQVPQDAAAGRHSVAGGTRSDYYALPQTVAADFGADDSITRAELVTGVNRLIPVRPSNSGGLIASAVANGGAIAAKNYSINLISLVGSLSGGKYLPLFAMTAAPLRVEIQLVSSLNAACLCDQTSANSGSAVTWQLSNVEFIGEFLQLSDSAISTIVAGSDSPLQFVCPAFSNYQFTAALANGASTQLSIPVSAKYSSLKGLITSVRNTAAAVQTPAFYPFSSTPLSMSQVYWRIGSNVLPSKPLTTNEEFFTETLKVFGSLSDQLYQPAVDLETYTLNAPVSGTLAEPDGSIVSTPGAQFGSGAFAVGIDLEVFAGSDRDAMFQGINTNNDDIFAVITHSGTAGAIASCRYDTYALYDRVIVCESGASYVRF